MALAALFCFCAYGTGEEPQAETTSPLTENRLSYSYAPCHNFNADFSLCPDGANALSAWNRAYLNASQLLQDDLLDAYGESLGNFISTPTPELSEMKALIEAQLEAHLREN